MTGTQVEPKAESLMQLLRTDVDICCLNDILSCLCPRTGISPKVEAGNLSNCLLVFCTFACLLDLFTFLHAKEISI